MGHVHSCDERGLHFARAMFFWTMFITKSGCEEKMYPKTGIEYDDNIVDNCHSFHKSYVGYRWFNVVGHLL